MLPLKLRKAGTAATLAALAVFCLGASEFGSPSGALAAEGAAIGQAEFTENCAGCHGVDGQGGGPIAEYFGIAPPDLTGLAKRNGGRFPLDWVYRIIDGREILKAHGTADMQVWGQRYRSEADMLAIDIPSPARERVREMLVRGRILEVIYYLQKIQAE